MKRERSDALLFVVPALDVRTKTLPPVAPFLTAFNGALIFWD